jgi:hypothetical protein
MHNWLEGISIWRIGSDMKYDYDDDAELEDDLISIDSDLEDLTRESQESADTTPRQTPTPQTMVQRWRSGSIFSMDNSDEEPAASNDGDETDNYNAIMVDYESISVGHYDDDDDDDEFDDDYIPFEEKFSFTNDQLEIIRQFIRDVNLPTWVHRPPGNLGEKAHGRLKADEYFILFAVIFPLVVPMLLFQSSNTTKQAILLHVQTLFLVSRHQMLRQRSIPHIILPTTKDSRSYFHTMIQS